MRTKQKRNGEGTIFKRKNSDESFMRWEGVVTLGRDASGKLKRKTFIGKTEKEVRDKVDSFKLSLRNESYRNSLLKNSGLTCEELFNRRFLVYEVQLKPSTLTGYDSIISTILTPHLGAIRLADLTVTHIEDMFIKLTTEHRICPTSGRKLNPLSKNTVRNVFRLLSKMLDEACLENLLTENPCSKYNIGKKFRNLKEKEVEILKPSEEKRLLQFVEDFWNGFAIAFILSTGVRKGELLALKWSNVDFNNQLININENTIRTKDFSSNTNKTTLSHVQPKSRASIRTVPLDDSILEKLKNHQDFLVFHKNKIGDLWTENNLVFPSTTGNYLEGSNLSRTLNAMCKKAGISPVGLHALRHTFASKYVKAGIDLNSLSRILGHEDILFMMKHYVHSDGSNLVKELNSLLDKLKKD